MPASTRGLNESWRYHHNVEHLVFASTGSINHGQHKRSFTYIDGIVESVLRTLDKLLPTFYIFQL